MAKKWSPTEPTIVSGELSPEMGPAMRALSNDRQRAFVIALQDGADLNYSRAAREAGYSTANPSSIHAVAYRLAHDPKVAAAISEEASRRLHAAVGWSVSQLITLCKTARSDGDKMKALSMILNRTGLSEKTTQQINVAHNVTIEDNRTPEQMVATIKMLSKQLNVPDVGALLIEHSKLKAPVVDAEFDEVEDADKEFGD